ncbi:hypothetical protein DFP72DRAFT_880090 [Ephemerocybe angulata]|uniref:BTB domain-containing protein n=1 Tax=Ephemerocybe angulata TaxID=980116 RepID=A0A8H6M9Q0_9AGAR|nr:hypothetical protein DFP72DRAFT_880090 [Tulosesus angulatus]
MSDTANVGEKESQLQTYRNDELYNWDLVSFLVDGYVFKMPRYQFVLGSEWFTTRYLQPNAGGEGACAADSARGETEGFVDLGMVPLEGVTASQFRTFLKLLFPIHSISTTLTLIKPEWRTILTLSTLWHFLDTRKLAISNLDPQMDDPIELITVGRAEYIPRWVMAGYEALTSKLGAITEEEAGAIGYQTAVRLYIVRHELSGGEQKEKRMKKKLCALFKEEMKALGRGEDERKVPSERPPVEVAQGSESKPEGAKVLVEPEQTGKDALAGISEASEAPVEEVGTTSTVPVKATT